MGLIMKNGIQYPGNVSSGGEGSYTLPIASTETLGGIKVGENLSITEDGTLNATGGSGGAFIVSDLQDVKLNELSNNQILVYDAEIDTWVNKDNVSNSNSVIMSKNEYNNQASISKNMVYFLTDNVEKLYCIKNGVFVDEAGEHSISKDAGTPVVNENHVCTDGSIAIEMYWSSSYNNNGVSILYKPNFPLNQRTLIVELNADTSIINNLSRIFYEGDGSYWNCINQSGNYSKSLILTPDQLTYTLEVSSYNEPTYIGIGTGINNKLYIENMYFEIRGVN